MEKKRILGQFFTKREIWLKEQVLDFVRDSKCKIAYDPFAGAGDMLDSIKEIRLVDKVIGLDIDNSLDWELNDSLINIPHVEDAIIITNPPYITNYSAARKGVISSLHKYFSNSIYSDIYLIALDKMLDAQKNVVAIIPETFINSKYKKKNLLDNITILEENPFSDTDTPVIVACFDGISKPDSDIKVYKNDKLIGSLSSINEQRLLPRKNVDMEFNSLDGWLAVRCVDTTNPANMISFNFKEELDYNWEAGIKVSSRLITLINIDIPKNERKHFIEECNEILRDLREKTEDVILSPFKGNMKNGRRRRRLDYKTCRAIVEKAYWELNKDNKRKIDAE